MSETLADIGIPPQFPDHTQLPESDGTFVFAERAEKLSNHGQKLTTDFNQLFSSR
ncbi:hypothetical protein [Nostoc sp. JL31]|uniref:hypothetical protein n=1 Tax=Nostoc sp. JL31 TaxID=2815395 RepID=UPI0025D366BB|nr:hypothetical protein [Nostoc sp. JL31]